MNDAPSPSGKAGDFDSPIAGSTPAGATCTKPAWMQTTVSMRAFLLAGAGCFSTPFRGGVLVPPPELPDPAVFERKKKQERRQQLPFLTGTRTGAGTGTGTGAGAGTGTGTCAGTCTGTARFATFVLAKVAFARFATFVLAKVAFARFATFILAKVAFARFAIFILAKVAFARFATFCRKIRRRSLKEGSSCFS